MTRATGLPLQPLPDPPVRALRPRTWAIPPLEGTLGAAQTEAEFRAQLKAWGFTLLPGLRPKVDPQARLWYHPAGVLLIGSHGATATSKGSARPSEITLLLTLDIGLYHPDSTVCSAERLPDTLETHARLAQDTDGTHYQMVAAVCSADRVAGVLAAIQRLGRLAGFDAMHRMGSQSSWVGRPAFDAIPVRETWPRSAWVPREVVFHPPVPHAPGETPPALAAALQWIGQRAPLVDTPQRYNQGRRASALTLLLQNVGRVARTRFPHPSDRARAARWARQASGEDFDMPLEFHVGPGQLTQAAAWACAWDSDRNPAALLKWVEQAPDAVLAAAIVGAPPAVPALPHLILHAITHVPGNSPHWDEIAASAPAVFRRLSERAGPAMLAAWGELSPWASALPRGEAVSRWGEVLMVAARECAQTSAPWPLPSPAVQSWWFTTFEELREPFSAWWRHQALDGAVAPPSPRPRGPRL